MFLLSPSRPEVANETKVVVTKEEKEATIKAERTQEIADDAQRDLDEALPLLVIIMYPRTICNPPFFVQPLSIIHTSAYCQFSYTTCKSTYMHIRKCMCMYVYIYVYMYAHMTVYAAMTSFPSLSLSFSPPPLSGRTPLWPA